MQYKKLEAKYEEILKYTVQEFIKEATPLSSSHLINKYNINYSSAKLRYLMNNLEEMGYLEKAHSSSGRKPTTKGLEYYAKFLSVSFEEELFKKLEKVLKNKEQEIDKTVDKAAELISEMTGLTLVTHKYSNNEVLKSIDMVEISKNMATIILVVSTGEVYSKILTFDDSTIKINDLRIAIKIFKDRLIDVELINLSKHILLLKDLLAKEIKNYQDIINSFVKQVFEKVVKNTSKNKVYGKNNIILSDGLNRESLSNMINLIENHSIWEKIESETNEDEKIKISIIDNGSFMSKRIENNNSITELAVVGPSASDYDAMKTALKVLEKFFMNSFKEKKNEENN
ncbi:heat-inducible transcriptional repressor HrcA [Mycoplasma leonicaptivi]|uniref:heat-inducible transcriptional repressor HrcA n=1 Tax=Mycoplasma leonicaptivi TaxID=36742 RepID=UPI0004845ED9|nr:heat-inducible transcriptional repressor HrcA [Mycoplasma leonicaptivi]